MTGEGHAHRLHAGIEGGRRPDHRPATRRAVGRSGRGVRHRHARRQAGVRDFRGAGRVRTGTDLGADGGRVGVGPGTRSEGRAAVQDDGGEAAPRHGGDGAPGDQGWGSVSRTRRDPADAVPARFAHGGTAGGWREVACQGLNPRRTGGSAGDF